MLLIATEDELSEAIATKLAGEAGFSNLDIRAVRRGGFGYLKANIRKFNEAAKLGPVLMLTDLDNQTCAPTLIGDWMGKVARSPNFLLRVAVREAEAWLLADREGFSDYLGLAKAKLVSDPERISDPKRYLLELAGKAKKEMRRGLTPAPKSAARQGFEYNPLLCRFVAKEWNVSRAASNSDSLARTIARLRGLGA